MGKQKILFLYLRTGGGHLAPAKAIGQYIDANWAQEAEAVLIDGLQSNGRVVRFLIEDGYRILQARARWAYELLYAANKLRPVSRSNLSLVSSLVKRHVREVIRKERPTKIVIFHFFLIRPVYEVLNEESITVPVYTVVTDPFTPHPMWFQRKDQRFILFSEQLRCHCLELGIRQEQISVFPFPVSSRFSLPMTECEQRQARERLGFSSEKKIVLVLGGSDGIPRGLRILRTLVSRLPETEVAIVCGNNKSLRNGAEKLKSQLGRQDMKIYGFVPFVHDLLNIADVVITKCGASTAAELLLARKIPVITDYLWEQEKGTMEYIRDQRFGIYEPDLENLSSLVSRLLHDPLYHQSFSENIKQAGLASGTPKVSEWLIRS